MYPLKFIPVFQRRIWGGRRLRQVLERPIPRELQGSLLGESWELADLPPGSVKADSIGALPDGSLSNRIAHGPYRGRSFRDIFTAHSAQIMGEAAALNGYFPLLIKFLDAQQNLSVQVHPDVSYAQKHPGAHLKNEAWYVLQADPGAKIYNGLKPNVDRNTFQNALQTGQVEPLLNAIPARAGDCHYLESGAVHALGAGVLAAEVQTPSDTTFRIFDWNRLMTDGKPRALHVEQALEVVNFNAPAPHNNSQTKRHMEDFQITDLVACEHFSVSRVEIGDGTYPLGEALIKGKPQVWIMLAGQAVIDSQHGFPVAVEPGETVLIPALLKSPRMRVVSPCTWLQIQMP
ncbi:MAG TPA: type I phosphomannose isomerase catalytic subunit [Phycisphaerae bacterium]|nr:type I phosphomannose isomerase catalytic subunit [Phycisphaerae bacterium]